MGGIEHPYEEEVLTQDLVITEKVALGGLGITSQSTHTLVGKVFNTSYDVQRLT